MAARGARSKIEVDFDKKQFKDTEYYSILNSSFKFQLGMASKSKLVLIKTKDII
jgi:hypothetical protein